MTRQHILSHDERGEIFRGTYLACIGKLHSVFGAGSADHALKHEGYSIKPEPVQDVLCGCGWGRLACPESELPEACPQCGHVFATE